MKKRKTLTTRITEEMRAKLEASAARAGRSLSQEIEMRLQQSYRDADCLYAVLDADYGARNVGVLLLLGRMLRDASAFAEITQIPDWLEDYGEFDTVVGAIDMALGSLRPSWPEENSDRAARYAGAALILVGDDDPVRQPAWATKVRSKLGKVGERLSTDQAREAVR